MNKDSTINILCATDDNYAPFCGIMLTSLFESNKDCRFEVYVFVDRSISEENKWKYSLMGKKYGHEIIFQKIDELEAQRFPINENMHITIPTYYRLFAAELLPKNVHKVIYLDSDMIVVDDIKPLWDIKLDNVAIAGVAGCRASYIDKCQSLGYPDTFGYFNAGVLVINLDFWREKALSEKIFDFISAHYFDLPWMDQDALNGVLYNSKELLPARYNFMTLVYSKHFWEDYTEESQRYYLDESRRKVVVHYAGRTKPWNYRSYGGPFFSDWEKYRRKSLWRDCRDTKPLRKHIKYSIKRYFFPRFSREQHRQWVVLPENKRFYKGCIV